MTTAPLMSRTAVSTLSLPQKWLNVIIKVGSAYSEYVLIYDYLSGENLPARAHKMSVYQHLHPTVIPV